MARKRARARLTHHRKPHSSQPSVTITRFGNCVSRLSSRLFAKHCPPWGERGLQHNARTHARGSEPAASLQERMRASPASVLAAVPAREELSNILLVAVEGSSSSQAVHRMCMLYSRGDIAERQDGLLRLTMIDDA